MHVRHPVCRLPRLVPRIYTPHTFSPEPLLPCLPPPSPSVPSKTVSSQFSIWTPLIFSLAHAILCGPGQMHEIEIRLVDGQLQRVYKNLWPSLRVFWLWAANEHKDAVYAVFEHQRHTFAQVFQRSLKAAAMFHDVYGVRKGVSLAACVRRD